MTSGYYTGEEEWVDEDWPTAVFTHSQVAGSPLSIEFVVILAALLVALTLGWAALHLVRQTDEVAIITPASTGKNERDASSEQTLSPLLSDPSAVTAPYDHYIVTQGLHGQSYGHMAVDIAAGKGEPIKSPISGIVSEKYFDAIGNPTLVIENERFKVTLLHGIYTVGLGEAIQLGEEIGKESNLGNTRDMQGQSCRNRDCGYHTHLNIFDKDAGSNINPLELIDG